MNTDKFPQILRKILAYRRKARVDFILSKVNIHDHLQVIDVGCGKDGRSFSDYVPVDWKITGIDILPPERVQHRHPNFTFIQQNAQDLSRFADCEFDLLVSIGMLEHITEATAFQRIVDEIRRVAKQYIVVVPYRYGWIEPHYGVPFFPLLPYTIKLALIKMFNLNNHREAVLEDPDFINKNNQWLSNEEYRIKFGDATIYILPTREAIAIIRKCVL